MLLRVVQVFPVTNHHPVALVERIDGDDLQEIQVGLALRCGGLRYLIEAVHATSQGIGKQLGLELVGEFGLNKGMILRFEDDPLKADELCSAMGRLAFAMQNVAQIDTDTILKLFFGSDNKDSTVTAIERYLQQEGVYDNFKRVFTVLDTMRKALPSLEQLRRMDQVQGDLNDQLKVLHLRGEARSTIGD